MLTDWKDKPESKSKDFPKETRKEWNHVKTKFLSLSKDLEERGGLPYVDVRAKGDWAAKEPLRQSFLFDTGADCNMISTQMKTAWEQEKVPLQTSKVRSEISSLMGGNSLCKEVVSLSEGIEFSVVDIPFDGVVGWLLATSWLEERKETSGEGKDFSLVKTLPDGRLSICNNTFDISKVEPYRCHILSEMERIRKTSERL